MGSHPRVSPTVLPIVSAVAPRPPQFLRLLRLRTRLMASPAAAPAAEFTQLDAARQSLIAISQSVPDIGAPAVRPPNGGMGSGHGDGAEQGFRAKLISISNQSPDARPAPGAPKNAAA